MIMVGENMKKIILFVIMALMLATPFASAELITRGAALDASLLYYQPVPAQPGDVIDTYIQIENSGGTASKAGTLTIIPSGPFILESEGDRVKEFPSIPAQGTFLTTTKVRIAKDANEGTSLLKVRVQEAGSSNWIDRDLSITLTGTSSALSIIEAKTEPATIQPGEKGTLSITVKNVGDTKVRNVELALDLTDLSLAPVGSSDSKTIQNLRGGAEQTFTFDLIAYPAAVANAYQLPITLSYDDETGNSASQEGTIGLVIGSTPELLVYFDQMALTKEQPSGEVTVRFVNKGLAGLKLLELEVLEKDGVSVTSETPIIYVGNIDADDYESATFSIEVNKDVDVLPLVVRYKDALNNNYEETYNLALNLRSANGNNGPNYFLWIVIIIVIGGGFWWWRKRKNKNSKKR